MKKCIYYMFGVVVLALIFSLTSCALDDPNVEPIVVDRFDSANTNELQLMQRIANNDGSLDNIVDGSSCLSVQFPYTVSFAGVPIPIASIEDLAVIESLFDAFDEDENVVELLFPISVTLADYTEVTLDDNQALEVLVASCVEGGADEDIECIDFIYPIQLFTFNRDLEQTTTVEVTNDSELRRFFTGLEEAVLVGLDFPVSFELYDDTTVVVNNNGELRTAIENVIDACDEDDDNDFGDDDFTKENLDKLLVECPWLVQEINRSNQYATTDYENFVLNFNLDGTVTARDREENLFHGEWSTETLDFRVVIGLSFEFLSELNLDWFVDDIGEGRIKLFAADDDKIIMKQYCEDQSITCTEDFIVDALAACNWKPFQVENTFLDDLSIDFSNMNIHVYDSNGEIVDEGNWAIEGEVIFFNDLSLELANYIGAWEVTQCSAVRFTLTREDEILIIQKEC